MLSAISAISAAPWKIAGVLGLVLALIAGGGALYLKGRSAGVAQERAAAATFGKVTTGLAMTANDFKIV